MPGNNRTPDRRHALGLLILGGVSCAVPHSALAQVMDWPLRSGFPAIDEQHLWIRQAGRSEVLHTRFRLADGSADLDGFGDLTWLFRDWRDGDSMHWMDIRLFDLLATVQTYASLVLGEPAEMVLNSGYRTPGRNATIEGAAANSQHIHGRAADISVTGIAHRDVRDVAEASRAPGLGQYPDFTHLDVGPPGRRWRG